MWSGFSPDTAPVAQGPATSRAIQTDSPLPHNGMNERRRPPRRGRGKRPSNPAGAETTDNPYREDADSGAETAVGQQTSDRVEVEASPPPPPPPSRSRAERSAPVEASPPAVPERSERDDAATNTGA